MVAITAAYHRRLNLLQKHLTGQQAILISKPNDIFYLTNFPQLAPTEREAFLLVLPQKSILFHHSFSPVSIKETWLEAVPRTNLEVIAGRMNKEKISKLFTDDHNLSIYEHQQLEKKLDADLTSLKANWIWQLRTVKDETEIAKMKKAGQIASQVMKTIRKQLKIGVTEQEVASKILSLMLENQIDKTAFPTIVAFGPGSALPHYQPRDIKLKAEMPVLIDLGVNFEGYNSDMTRSFWFGNKPSKKFQEIESIIKDAYRQTVDLLNKRPNDLKVKGLDKTARDQIVNAGYGDQFLHTTGHGLGIEIHEPPSIDWSNIGSVKIGMTITIEPGIYLPKQFGYRHENTFLVTKNGAESLTQ